MDVYSLDIETSSTEQTHNPYALEPFRLQQGKGQIDSVAVCRPDDSVVQLFRWGAGDESMDNLPELLGSLSGKKVAAHYAVFDVAWLLNKDKEDRVKRIVWNDTATLAKWISNGQRAERPKKSYSLASLVSQYMQGHPLLEEFLDIKDDGHNQEAGVNTEYWNRRGYLDAVMTRHLFEKLLDLLPEPMVNGFNIEQRVIVPVAKSWNLGINLDIEKAAKLKPRITKAKSNIAKSLKVPESTFTSPKQLSHYLFDVLDITPVSRTPTGAPSTKADDLKMMHQALAGTDLGEVLKRVLDFKQISTLETKFINGIMSVGDYVGEPVNHSAPKIFSTYTGRFTYSSSTLKKSKKFKPGIATHQLPRKGPTRQLLIAPEGKMVGELDAAAQEMRGMAIESRDPNLIEGFNNNLDLHGGMGADIAAMSYEEFMHLYKSGSAEALNYRYAGKLLNLSCQYRIGYKSLVEKFFSTYGIIISRSMSNFYLNTYKKRYHMVTEYWKRAIFDAMEKGYAETVAGRRYYLEDWSRMKWATESSAINFPVQGFGADHKVLAISELYQHYPEADFVLDLHDGLWNYVPEDHGRELLLDMADHLSNLNYSEIWDKDIPVALPFDAQIGSNFGNVTPIHR